MSTINDKASDISAVLSRLGVPQGNGDSKAGSRVTKQTLGQEDFLRLLTTQISYQDPFKPLDNAEFVSQMAQFSTVSGVGDVKNEIARLGEVLANNRVATFSNLLGARVLAPGGDTVVDENGMIEGVVDVAAPANKVQVAIQDEAGRLLETLDLGPQPAGLTGFSWSAADNDPSGRPGSRYRVTAVVTQRGGNSEAPASTYERVTGVDMRGTTEVLTLRNDARIDLASVKSIRQ